MAIQSIGGEDLIAGTYYSICFPLWYIQYQEKDTCAYIY